jgi:pullulanase
MEYYKRLIALRQHHPACRLGTADLVRQHLEFLKTPRQVVAFRLKDLKGIDDWQQVVVILNASKQPQRVTIPKDTYTIVCEDGHINEQSTNKIYAAQVTVHPQSALIMYE